ncbi:hypothetical protein [Streptococcus himalayensis]|uniref:Uncharacterized protein n=1 Tax=Streptococcus himalayensis TaxID=1888195 RepID=A0A917A7B4_9STRE|nr:hypothetical protein [Streptococcus himalayensis]GGE30605.1 hypothetical protein GCM10011510_09800 [Streptococcus himalayensis]
MKKVLLTSAAALLAAASIGTAFAADNFPGAVTADKEVGTVVGNPDERVAIIDEPGALDQTGGDTKHDKMIVEDDKGNQAIFIDDHSDAKADKKEAAKVTAKAGTTSKALPKTSAVK